jgi:hypothetical protein
MVQKQRIPTVAERRGPDPAVAEAPAHGVHVRHQQHQYQKVHIPQILMTFPKNKVPVLKIVQFCAALLILRIESFPWPKLFLLPWIIIRFFVV